MDDDLDEKRSSDLTAKLLPDGDGGGDIIGDDDAGPLLADASVALDVPGVDTSADDKEPLTLPEFTLDPQAVFDGQDYQRGEAQPNQCRDVPFGVLWYAQLIGVVVIAWIWGVPVLMGANTSNDKQQHDSTRNASGVMYFVLLASAASLLVSFLSLTVLSTFRHLFLQLSLLFSVFVSLVIAATSALQGNWISAVFSAFLFLVGICYYFAVQRRVPFAAANINVGLTAVRKNGGIIVVGLVSAILVMMYCAIWSLAVIGVAGRYCHLDDSKNNDEGPQCDDGVAEGLLFGLLVILFWTQQVLVNIVHVTTAGVVGTWWFAPDEASSFCSSAVSDSFKRATTTSFGSICFGSLLVAIIKALRQIVYNTRQTQNRQGEDSILLCLAECLLSCIEGLLRYFNKWAFIYVGLYGYDYIGAGRNVMSLFDARGWDVIINDDLVSNALSLTCLVLSSLSGVFGALILHLQGGSWLEALGDPSRDPNYGAAFGIAFVLGLIVSSVLMGVVDSAVSSAIVCFAEAPSDLSQNHPVIYDEMLESWRKVYGTECGF